MAIRYVYTKLHGQQLRIISDDGEWWYVRDGNGYFFPIRKDYCYEI